jgi:heme exporter protein A
MPLTIAQPRSRNAQTCPAAARALALGRVIDGRAILRDLNFSISSGEFIALLGANGAGKSTLLKMMATLSTPTHGELYLFDESVRTHSLAVRRRIGLIGHSAMMYRDLSALENLIFFGRLYGVNQPHARADELLERMALSHRAADPIKTFSRGMLQRVAIARALMHDPDLLLADEPFAGLDAPSARMLEGMLESLHGEGKTIILTTHDLHQGLNLAHRVLVLRQGELVLDESPGVLTEATLLKEVAGA